MIITFLRNSSENDDGIESKDKCRNQMPSSNIGQNRAQIDNDDGVYDVYGILHSVEGNPKPEPNKNNTPDTETLRRLIESEPPPRPGLGPENKEGDDQ